MSKYVRAELLKLSKSKGYWVLLAVSLGLGVALGTFVRTGDGRFVLNGFQIFMESLVNQNVIIPLHFIFFCFYSTVSVCGEYTNRTFALSLLNGMTRRQIFWSKTLVFLLGLLPLIFIKTIVGTVITTAYMGFTNEPLPMLLPDMLLISICAVLCSAVLGCLYLLLAILVRNNSGTIGNGIVVSFCLPFLAMLGNDVPVLRFLFPYQIQQISAILQPESWIMFFSVMCISGLVLISASAVIFDKTELK